ncbi:MAG: prepilin-type N-terminal cleavage/methylation domain-containing protein [bacterium]
MLKKTCKQLFNICNSNSKKGFTLLEILIATAIFTISALAVYKVIIPSVSVANVVDKKFEVTEEMQSVMNFVITSIKRCEYKTLVVSNESGQPYSSLVEYSLANDPARRHRIYQEGNNLVFQDIKSGSTNTKILSKNLYSSVFSCTGMNYQNFPLVMVMISFEFDKNILKQRERLITLRNKIEIRNF